MLCLECCRWGKGGGLDMLNSLLDVEMSPFCWPKWAHLHWKSLKSIHFHVEDGQLRMLGYLGSIFSGWLPVEVFRACPGPGADPGHSESFVCPIWPWNASGTPGEAGGCAWGERRLSYVYPAATTIWTCTSGAKWTDSWMDKKINGKRGNEWEIIQREELNMRYFSKTLFTMQCNTRMEKSWTWRRNKTGCILIHTFLQKPFSIIFFFPKLQKHCLLVYGYT